MGEGGGLLEDRYRSGCGLGSGEVGLGLAMTSAAASAAATAAAEVKMGGWEGRGRTFRGGLRGAGVVEGTGGEGRGSEMVDNMQHQTGPQNGSGKTKNNHLRFCFDNHFQI